MQDVESGTGGRRKTGTRDVWSHILDEDLGSKETVADDSTTAQIRCTDKDSSGSSVDDGSSGRGEDDTGGDQGTGGNEAGVDEAWSNKTRGKKTGAHNTRGEQGRPGNQPRAGYDGACKKNRLIRS